MAVRAATAPPAVAERAGPPSADPRWGRGLSLVAIAVACVPVLLAVVWAIRIGWWPAADDALIAFRSLDVFSTDTPLVGMPSTVGTAGQAVGYHPGPMAFWVMAIPVRVFGGIGLALGAGAVNLASIVAIGWLCRRRGGTGLVVGTMAVVGVLAASLGRDLLISPWNPHIALLPMMLMFVAAWFTAEGRAEALPALAVSASFVAQAHLGYVGLAALVTLWALAAHAWQLRRARARGDGNPRLGAPHLVALAIVAICWAPVLWQQVTSDPGNLTVVVRSMRHPEDGPRGNEFATDAVTRSIGVVPLWARGPQESRDVLALYAEPQALQTVTAAAVVLVLAGCLAAMWRRRADRTLVPLIVTGFVVLAGAWFTAGRLPLGLPAPYRVRWLWPIAAFVWLAAGLGLASMALRRRRPPFRALGVLLAGALSFTLVAAAWDPGSTEAQDTGALDAIDKLADAAQREVGAGTWLVRADGGEAFFAARTGLVWRLREHGLDVRMPSDEDNARTRMGARITAADDEADGVLLLLSGPAAFEDDGGQVLAHSDGSPRDRREELLATRRQFVELLQRERPTLTATGEDWLRDDPDGERRRALDDLQEKLARDPGAFMESPALEWVELGYLEVPGADHDMIERLSDYRRWFLERQFRLDVLRSP